MLSTAICLRYQPLLHEIYLAIVHTTSMSKNIRAATSEISRMWTDHIGEITTATSWYSRGIRPTSSDSTMQHTSRFISDTNAVSPLLGYVSIIATTLILTSIIGTVAF